MKKHQISPNGYVIIGFILLNVLGGIFYRYTSLFNTPAFLYMLLLSTIIAIVILFWGFKIHLASYKHMAE